MKKLILSLTFVALLSCAAYAQSTWSLTPSLTSISGLTGTFDITVALNTTTANVSSFDLFLGSDSAGADAFSITGHASLQGSANDAGSPTFPDQFLAPTTPSNPQNYFTLENYDPDDPNPNDANGDRSLNDLGLSFGTDKTVSGGTIQLETLHFSYSFGSLPAPGTSWTFSTTPGASTSPGFGSYFYSSAGTTFNATSQGTFTVSVVPEPATWSLFGLGGLGAAGMTMLRRRRSA